MMERIFLCLLCLSGWSVSSCLPRQYHYVADPMTWTEAQAYCRETYTDLATIENPEEMDQVKFLVSSHHYNSYFWIGLFSKIQWKWSDGYKERGADYRNWQNIKDNEPDFYAANQFCVMFGPEGRWWDGECPKSMSFICYRGTQQDPEFVFVSDKMSWSSAQRFCRENHIDLATVRNDTENQKMLNVTPSGTKAWFGLYRDPDIYWSDGSGSSSQFWSSSIRLGSMSVICGAADLKTSGKWRAASCEDRFPFVCYSLLKRQVIKLRLKPEDPSVDLNAPAVKADILRELQDRLKASGLSGVTLKWREQPDGKVFHKEGERSHGREDSTLKLKSDCPFVDP